ncbi:hypothetical protein BDW74DRAFT_71374 [Aspergillus multicolor]|uniref:C2H2-type zinc finger protein n=1 Tax=Aspergillus multicolor TaxID=41759 RepID=UPI003CCE3017
MSPTSMETAFSTHFRTIMPPSRGPGTASKKSCVCPYCQRDFRRREHLQRHVRLHTNEKPYVCDCKEAFARRDLLKRHQRLAHGGVEVSPSSSATPPQADRGGSLSTHGAANRRESAVHGPYPVQRATSPAAAPVQEAGSVDHVISSYQDPGKA